MRLLYTSLILILVQAQFIFVFADDEDELPNPITPEKRYYPNELGVFAGIGGAWQSGEFCSDCPSDFLDGAGVNYLAGIFYEPIISNNWRYGIAGGILYSNLESIHIEKEQFDAKSLETGKTELATAYTRHIGSANFFSLFAQPYLKWYFSSVTFLKMGMTGSFVVSSGIKHEVELTQKSVLLSNGEIGVLYFKDSGEQANATVLQDEDFPQVKSFQLALTPMIGIDIPISNSFTLSPVFSYSLPLTKMSDNGDNFKINSWAFILELRHSLYNMESTKINLD